MEQGGEIWGKNLRIGAHSKTSDQRFEYKHENNIVIFNLTIYWTKQIFNEYYITHAIPSSKFTFMEYIPRNYILIYLLQILTQRCTVLTYILILIT